MAYLRGFSSMYKGRRDFFLALSPYVGLSSNSPALQFNWSAVAQNFKATGRGGPSEGAHEFQGQPLKLLKVLLYSFITAYPMPYKAAIGKHWKNAAFPIVGCCPWADPPSGVAYPSYVHQELLSLFDFDFDMFSPQ